MPTKTRIKTDYPGVYFIEGKANGRSGNERIYYIFYRLNGKQVEEKVGRQYSDDMTAARANNIRSLRIEGRQLTNNEQREEKRRIQNRWTIEKLWDEYRRQLSGGDAAKSDWSRWRLYLKKPFSQKEPHDLFKLDVDRLRINLLKKRSPQTIKHTLALLRRIINFGVDRGICPALPFKIGMPSVDNIKTEDLTPEQLQALFAAIENTPYQTAATMMKLALYTGMRRGEIFKLKWVDLDFHRGFIHIVNPKGGKSQKIPMNQNTRELLESISRNDSEYLFPARGGGPRKDIAKELRAIREQAGLPADFRPMHGLRHVYATMLASSGKVDMYTLQKLMTHKSPQMTQRYAHYRDEALKRAGNTVDDILADALQPGSGEQKKTGTGKNFKE